MSKNIIFIICGLNFAYSIYLNKQINEHERMSELYDYSWKIGHNARHKDIDDRIEQLRARLQLD